MIGGLPTTPLGIPGERDNSRLIEETALSLATYQPSVTFMVPGALFPPDGTVMAPYPSLSAAVAASLAGHEVVVSGVSDGFTGTIGKAVQLSTYDGQSFVIGK